MKSFFVFTILFVFLGAISGPAVSAAKEKNKGSVADKLKIPKTDPAQMPLEKYSCEVCSHLRDGKELLQRGKYEESIEHLKVARRELPVVGDYALFFIAKAHAEAGRFDDSNETLHEILSDYPDTLLSNKVKSLEIRNIVLKAGRDGNDTGDGFAKILGRYVAERPEDTEMKLLYGRTLKKRGEKEEAKKILRQVYASNGPFSDMAYEELGPSDITADDLLERASNLMKNMEYRKAEALLRKALVLVPDSSREEVLKKLGTALFRQKRYREAASEFSEAGDIYNAARSLFRAGEMAGFQKAVTRLVSMEDKRAASLLLAFASKKRREGKTEEAMNIYSKVRSAYPSRTEDVLWGIVWTSYRQGDYEKALYLLTELCRNYPSPRYAYWRARCLEHSRDDESISPGKDGPKSPFSGHRNPYGDFYALLSDMRGWDLAAAGAAIDFTLIVNPSCAPDRPDSSGERAKVSSDLSRSLERFRILVSAGMKVEAISELVHISREVSDPGDVLSLGMTLKDAGAYRKAIAIVSRLPGLQKPPGQEDRDINGILYPFAFWQIVTEAAKVHGLDPLILLSVMREESRFDPEARSTAGAVGLMQIMPQTADALSDHAVTNPEEIAEVRTNITIGAYYLSSLIREFGSLPVALAAYNAGEERVREWMREGAYGSYDEFLEDIPYDETRHYVRKVLMSYATYRHQAEKNFSSCGKQAHN